MELNKDKTLSDKQLKLLKELDEAFFDFSIEDKATLIGADPDTYDNWINGDNTAKIKNAHIEKTWELISILYLVLKPEALFWFLGSSKNDELSPLEKIKLGRIDEMLKLVESYLDPSYG